MLTRVVATQGHVVDLADVQQFFAAGIADGTLNVFLHFAQSVSQFPLDRLQYAFALNMLVFALVEV